MKNNYLLKFHKFYADSIENLKFHIKDLKNKLSEEEFLSHPDVKFAERLRNASRKTIPDDPNLPEYRLKGDLNKFRRYKKGLQRYRLFFCFSSQPPIIVYLYINDKSTLRKEGAKTDPYSIFTTLVNKKQVSSNPSDKNLQKWLSDHVSI